MAQSSLHIQITAHDRPGILAEALAFIVDVGWGVIDIKQFVFNGMLNLSILHTSCSLMIQENADITVLKDIENFLRRIAPEDNYLHDTEGPDDMPAHLKSLLTQSNLTMSIKNKKILLGTWQGIFLLEHRYQPKNRELFFHLLGE